jgi:hypothetical protein
VGASVEAESKRCSRCRRVLDPGCFAFKCRDRGILQSRCRECMAELLHLHYLRRSASYKARAAVNNKRITAQNRQRVREVLRDARCADCRLGDLAVLEFDHREPGEKRDDISSLVRQHCSWSVISREIAKCDVVCANCHRKRTARYFGWRRLVGLEELALPQLPDRASPLYERIKSARSGRARRHRNRTYVYAYLHDHPCELCGEDDPVVLEFDHVGAKSREVTAIARHGGWSDLLAEIEKCRVLCANCHRRSTAQQAGRTP